MKFQDVNRNVCAVLHFPNSLLLYVFRQLGWRWYVLSCFFCSFVREFPNDLVRGLFWIVKRIVGARVAFTRHFLRGFVCAWTWSVLLTGSWANSFFNLWLCYCFICAERSFLVKVHLDLEQKVELIERWCTFVIFLSTRRWFQIFERFHFVQNYENSAQYSKIFLFINWFQVMFYFLTAFLDVSRPLVCSYRKAGIKSVNRNWLLVLISTYKCFFQTSVFTWLVSRKNMLEGFNNWWSLPLAM